MGEGKRIGIAIVEQGGCVLVGVRGEAGPLPGYAEFPGGKCKEGEGFRECAERECREETGVEVCGERELMRVDHEYAHGKVELSFWLCRPVEEVVAGRECGGFRWRAKGELRGLKFPEANARVVEMLVGE